MTKIPKNLGGEKMKKVRAVSIIVFVALLCAMMVMPAAAQTLTCPYDICVNETGWWRDGGAFNASGEPINDAVYSNSEPGDTIFVYNGSYGTGFHINNPNLKVIGEGADVVTVNFNGGGA